MCFVPNILLGPCIGLPQDFLVISEHSHQRWLFPHSKIVHQFDPGYIVLVCVGVIFSVGLWFFLDAPDPCFLLFLETLTGIVSFCFAVVANSGSSWAFRRGEVFLVSTPVTLVWGPSLLRRVISFDHYLLLVESHHPLLCFWPLHPPSFWRCLKFDQVFFDRNLSSCMLLMIRLLIIFSADQFVKLHLLAALRSLVA